MKMKIPAVLVTAAALIAAPVGAASATVQPEPVEVVWLMPESGWEFVPFSDPRALDGRTVGEGAFPQTLVDGEPPCERWVQIDTYTSEDAATYTADSLLHYGEDWDGIRAWRFVYGGTCPDPTPTATTPIGRECVVDGEVIVGWQMDDPCPPVGEVSENPPETVLPETGPTGIAVWLGLAGLLSASGITLLIRSRKRA